MRSKKKLLYDPDAGIMTVIEDIEKEVKQTTEF